MSNFEFPTNIRQIGSIHDGLRIYVEDYVCSYLQQYAEAGGYDEKLAMLVGRHLTIDGQPVLFISGAVQGRYCIEENGILVFSDKSRKYIDEQMDQYFNELEVVGWMQSQPSYGTYLNSSYHNYHLENFPEAYQVLFVMDPIEKLNSFYVYDDKEDELKEARGYFVYYEKNRNMHEYMLDNKLVDDKRPEYYRDDDEDDLDYNEEDYDGDGRDDDDDDFDEEDGPSAYARERLERTLKRKNQPRTVTQSKGAVLPQRKASEGEIRRRQGVRSRKVTADQKRTVNMLVSLSAVLFLICFVMGAGLIRGEERIALLEENLAALNTAYRNIVAGGQQTENVFAPQTDTVEQPEAASGGVVFLEDGNQLLSGDGQSTDNVLTQDSQLTAQPVNTGAGANGNTDTAGQTTPASTQEQSQYSGVPDTYVVQEGDNLIGISQRFYGTNQMVNKIMEANDLDDPDKIYFGKVLILPK